MTLEKIIPIAWLEEIPFGLRVAIVVVCYGAPAILLAPESWRAWLRNYLKFKPPSITWVHIACLSSVIVIAQFIALNKAFISNSIYGLSDWWRGFLTDIKIERQEREARLLTRPICDSGDCENFSFLVRECELQAVQVGGLATPPRRRGEVVGRGDPEIATEHFRECLIGRGLSWEPCKFGEPECRLLRTFSIRIRRSMPSFITERMTEANP